MTVEPGALHLIPTPLGNPADMSPRALETAATVDVLLAEDTRTGGDLLRALGRFRPMTSCHEQVEASRASRVLDWLREGKSVGLMADAGTPVMSDPGLLLVRAVAEAGYRIVSVPGPCAFVAALVASGLPVQGATFVGFLPRAAKARKDAIARVASSPGALVFYEAPHRILETLEALRDVLGDRRACLAWNMTKSREKFFRGRLDEILTELSGWEFQHGESTLVVEGANPEEASRAERWRRAEALRDALARHDVPLSAVRDAVSAACDLPRREVYRWLHDRDE